jgi:hypothetical protein
MKLIDPPIADGRPADGRTKLTARPAERADASSAAPALLDLTAVISCREGIADWKYRCPDGHPFDPDRTAAITLDILQADETPSHPGRLARYPSMTFLGRIGLAAIAQDMRVVFESLDPANAQRYIHDELTVTNPALPHRGTVHITIDGAIRWHCRIRNEPHCTDGLYITQITNTIALALASIQIAAESRKRCPESARAEPPRSKICCWPPG